MLQDTKDQVSRLLRELKSTQKLVDPFKQPEISQKLSKVVSILEVWKDDLIIQERDYDNELKELSEDEMEWLRENAPAIWVQHNG